MENDLLTQKLGFNRLKVHEPLKLYNNWKVGGAADYLYEAQTTDELKTAVIVARSLDLPYVVLGLGANSLVSDKGIRGLTIINKTSSIKFYPHGLVEVDSGVNLATLMKEAWEHNLYGLERMYKAPGTVGGAIFMNAGEVSRQEYFGHLVSSVKILDQNNNLKELTGDQCEFSYRTSRFQRSGEIILSAKLILKQVHRDEIEERIREIMVTKKNQPPGPSGGSTFRNPPEGKIAMMLDELGLKGHQVGGAKFSDSHANFIINTGTATASDVKALIELAKEKVQAKYGFIPTEEIRYIGDWN